MTDNRKAGIALIAGAVGGIVTMAVHPHRADSMTPDQIPHLVVTSGLAHSLAIVSFVVLFLGACGLTRRIAGPDRLAFAGLVVYGFAAVAVMMAAAVSGFVMPHILLDEVSDARAAAPQWQIVAASIFQINQAFAGIFSIGLSAAIVLWSVSIVRNGGLPRWIAVYGCVAAPLFAVLVVVGHVRMDVHGMIVLVLIQAVWYVGAGVVMCRREVVE